LEGFRIRGCIAVLLEKRVADEGIAEGITGMLVGGVWCGWWRQWLAWDDECCGW
jgi:hypothetical protein